MRRDRRDLIIGRFEGERLAPSLLAGLTLFALLVLVAVSCGGTAGEQHAEEPAEDEPQAGTDEERAGADLEDPSLGSESAPVVMIEYADYQ